ncbi:hypothetical protein [Flavobacterium silvaticum]|uniref:Uncharacterized protein n=1 Tax=Flavobacterium silvaticum TaxID=1852020 RepID=A0A972FVI0_9FLAO|nr:hypothetical protein [Flavobacterium silvaticum]NMH28792.1 hypothetical protein [Flavobacterium silvaticum]
MKSKTIVRILSAIGFLLLIAPFYDHCNGSRLRRVKDEKAEEVIVDSISPINAKSDTVVTSVPIRDGLSFKSIYRFMDDPESENAYEISQLGFEQLESLFTEKIPFKELQDEYHEKGMKKFVGNISFWIKNLCFSFIVLFTILIFPISFSRWTKMLYRLQFVNLLFLIISICALMLDGSFEQWSQIKWGYYVFTIVQLNLLHFTRKLSVHNWCHEPHFSR